MACAQRSDMAQGIQKYWTIRYELGMIDGVVEKERRIIIPSQLQKIMLSQLCSRHGIEKLRLLACESIYWVNMNTKIEKHNKALLNWSGIQNMQPQDKTVPYDTSQAMGSHWHRYCYGQL